MGDSNYTKTMRKRAKSEKLENREKKRLPLRDIYFYWAIARDDVPPFARHT